MYLCVPSEVRPCSLPSFKSLLCLRSFVFAFQCRVVSRLRHGQLAYFPAFLAVFVLALAYLSDLDTSSSAAAGSRLLISYRIAFRYRNCQTLVLIETRRTPLSPFCLLATSHSIQIDVFICTRNSYPYILSRHDTGHTSPTTTDPNPLLYSRVTVEHKVDKRI